MRPGPVRGTTDPADCSFFPGVGTDGVYTSADGGTTWTNRGCSTTRRLAGLAVRQRRRPGDRVRASLRPSGKARSAATATDAYYQSLASYKPGQQPGNQAPEFIVVSRSSDNGGDLVRPGRRITKASGFTFNDKNAIWADKNPSSPYFGRRLRLLDAVPRHPWARRADPHVLLHRRRPDLVGTPAALRASNNSVTGGRQGSAVRTDGRRQRVRRLGGRRNQVYAVSDDGGVSYSGPGPSDR